MIRTLLSLHNLKFKHKSQSILDNISGSVKEDEKIGLIGRNGAGKTTLLKIIAGLIKPTQGSIQKNCSVFYLPQLNLDDLAGKKKVYEYIEERNEEWWETISFLEKHFELKLPAERRLRKISGGEFTQLNLAIAFTSKAELLLLDEPSNHLDIKALKQLEDILKNPGASYIIISHNAFFLDKVTERIWELADGKITEYGFSYYEYKKEKERKKQAKQRKYTAQVKQLKQLNKSREREAERASRSAQTGRKLRRGGSKGKHDRGMSRTEMGYFKDRSEIKASKKKDMFAKREQGINEKLALFKQPIVPKIFLNLKSSRESGQKRLINVLDGKIIFAEVKKTKASRTESSKVNKTLLKNISLDVFYGDRLVISGLNGTGKTTLLNFFVKEQVPGFRFQAKQFEKASDLKYAYIDQNYKSIDPDKSILANVLQNNKNLPEKEAKQILANLLLNQENDFSKKAGSLSGGDLARLTFAKEISRDLDLLVLDEPTNNLDLENIEVIISAISEYQGALIVVSHDIDFLNKIKINKAFTIKTQSFEKMKATPIEKEAYYQELTRQ